MFNNESKEISSGSSHSSKKEKEHNTLHKVKKKSKKSKHRKKTLTKHLEDFNTKSPKESKYLYKYRICREAKKNMLNKDELNNFIIGNDLIHYNWHPSKEFLNCLKKGKWSREEESLLRNNVETFAKEHDIDDPTNLVFFSSLSTKEEIKKWRKFKRHTGFYQEIAKDICRAMPNIYMKFLTMFNRTSNSGQFTKDEDRKLADLYARHGRKWSRIAREMGRTLCSVNHRYYKCLDSDSGIKGHWKQEEIDRLKSAVRQLTNTNKGEEVLTGIKWRKVAKIVKTRNGLMCRQKWLNDVCWKDSYPLSETVNSWNREKDVELITKIYESCIKEECEIDWLALHEDIELSRSPGWLHQKFSILKKRHCTSIDVINSDFEDIIDSLYKALANDIHNSLSHE